ncbi:MAG: hypothetical protein K6C94_08675 [Candidatus Gastranaerophilales bacterium]|nr:hypothetical protein [Candidatus Gastranaerophilales bacterium]
MLSKQSKTNKQLMSISSQREMIACRVTNLMANDVDSSVDPRVKLLEYQDRQLDMQQKSLETELNALSANLENLQKLKEENLKAVPKLSL